MNATWLQQIRHLLRNGRKQEAACAVEEARAKTPEDPLVLVAQALVAYFGKDDYPGAMRLSIAALQGARDAGDKQAEACGMKPPVHKWNLCERDNLTAELDAAYFILYGTERNDMIYVLTTFQGTRRKGLPQAVRC